MPLDASTRYYLLRKLAEDPELSQRALAKELGISLGKTNYCLRALLEKGYVKAVRFKDSRRKQKYLYKLTPAGIAERSRAASRFLAKKQREHETLAAEIEELRREVGIQE